MLLRGSSASVNCARSFVRSAKHARPRRSARYAFYLARYSVYEADVVVCRKRSVRLLSSRLPPRPQLQLPRPQSR